MPLLGKAVAIASKVHATQRDKGGKSYILHPIRVMMRLRTDDEELMSIAILHDVVEDSDWTLAALRAEGFSDRVIDALSLLTHDHVDSYEEYVKKIATNRDATRIKLEDLRDNSDITRLKGLREKDFKRMEKYHRAYLYLRKTLDTMEDCGY
jgi:(p)ppGpp synthase/HD superfamily hydrolase